MARYLRAHKDGGSWYQRWIPEELRSLFGNRKVIKRYVPQMAPTAADKLARGYAYQDDQEFAAWLRIPAEQRPAIAAAGPRAARLTAQVAFAPSTAELATGDISILSGRDLDREASARALQALPPDASQAECLAALVPTATARPATAAERFAMIQHIESQRAELAGLAPLALQAAPAAEHTFDALYKLWLGKGCKGRTDTHARAARYLAQHLGNVDYRHVTKTQFHGFRKWLPAVVPTAPMQNAILNAIKGMYSEAIHNGDMTDNPAHGVSVRVAKAKAAHFTGAQIKAILAKAEAIKWGGKRHAEAMFLLRLATFQGLRINEIAQLAKADVDVAKIGGKLIPYLHLREGEGQSLKTGDKNARRVPLHPMCGDFLSFAKNAKDGPVFGAYPDNPSNGRAFWIIAHFNELLTACGIEGAGLSQKSLRKSFHRAMSDARLHPDAQRFLTGHAGKDVHDKVYNNTGGLALLADDIAKVDPLAIED